MDTLSPPDVFLFEEFRFDGRGKILSRRSADGEWQPVSLGSRALAILGILVEEPGELVSKDKLMRLVWPGTAVEEANLSVQISALRRALDKESVRGSCIQTVSGRGYRFVAPVKHHVEAPHPVSTRALDVANGAVPPNAVMTRFARRHGRVFLTMLLAGLSLVIAGLLVLEHGRTPGRTVPPPLSLVVLPVDYPGGDSSDNETVVSIAKDLPQFLASWRSFKVVAADPATAFTGEPGSIQRVGEETGVRYGLKLDARRVDATLRIDVGLISTETGAQLWWDRYEVRRGEDGFGADDITPQMVWAVVRAVLELDAARDAADHPASPNALLQARVLTFRPWSMERQRQLIALFGRAVELDPSSALAKAGLAEALLDSTFSADDPEAPAKLRQAQKLITQAELLSPLDGKTIWTRVYLLGKQDRCDEVIAAATRAIDDHPSMPGLRDALHFWIGLCQLRSGRAAEAIPLFEQSIRDNPRNVQNFNRDYAIGFALVFLGRYDEAIPWFRKSLVTNPSESIQQRGFVLGGIAAAQALGGHIEDARATAAETMRLWPTLTARSFHQVKFFSPIATAQVLTLRNGLRLAGVRDHADEDEDFGLPPDTILHTNYRAQTPTTVPGAQVIATHDLAVMLEQSKPLVIDVSVPWGDSLPGAIGLWGAGIGGGTADEYQSRLGTAMRQLTGGDPNKPIVTLSWNAERYQGRNLALRLVALGYTNVCWYRGGREAWEAASLPETQIDMRDW